MHSSESQKTKSFEGAGALIHVATLSAGSYTLDFPSQVIPRIYREPETQKTDPAQDESYIAKLLRLRSSSAILRNLENLRELAEDWDSYGSPAVSERLIQNAKAFLNSVEDMHLPKTFVVPVSGGGVQLEWNVVDKELEVDFLQDNLVRYLKIVKDNPAEEGDFSIGDTESAHELIEWLKRHEP